MNGMMLRMPLSLKTLCLRNQEPVNTSLDKKAMSKIMKNLASPDKN